MKVFQLKVHRGENEIMSVEQILAADLTPREQAIFSTEIAQVRKDKAVAFLLTFFLGGFGGHRFYMGDIGLGVLYLLFFWTLIPALVALVELFLIFGRVDRYNEKKTQELIAKLKLMRPE